MYDEDTGIYEWLMKPLNIDFDDYFQLIIYGWNHWTEEIEA